jgi:hypothetical protein
VPDDHFSIFRQLNIQFEHVGVACNGMSESGFSAFGRFPGATTMCKKNGRLQAKDGVNTPNHVELPSRI